MFAVIIQVVFVSTLLKQTYGAACLKVEDVDQCHLYGEPCYTIQKATFNCLGKEHYHCARNPTSTSNKFIEECAVPKECGIGEEPIIEYGRVAGQPVANVSCVKCQDKSRYSNQKTWSYEISECPKKKSDCKSWDHKVLCDYENTDDVYTMNTRCRCDVRNGYIIDKPYDPTKNACTHETGFGCMRARCFPAKDVLLKGYVCKEKCHLGESRSSEKTDDCIPNSTLAPPTTAAPPVQEITTNKAPPVTQPVAPPSTPAMITTTPKSTTSTLKFTTTTAYHDNYWMEFDKTSYNVSAFLEKPGMVAVGVIGVLGLLVAILVAVVCIYRHITSHPRHSTDHPLTSSAVDGPSTVQVTETNGKADSSVVQVTETNGKADSSVDTGSGHAPGSTVIYTKHYHQHGHNFQIESKKNASVVINKNNDEKVDSCDGVKKDGENENVQIDSSDGDTDEEKEKIPLMQKSLVNLHQPSQSHQGSTSSISSNRRISIPGSLPNMSSKEDSKNEVDGLDEPLIVSDSAQRTSSSRSAAKLSRRESRSKVDLSTKETNTAPEERQRSSSLSVFTLYRHKGLDIDTKKKMIEHVIDKNTPFLVDNMVPETLYDHFHSQGLFIYSTIRDGTETLFTSAKNRFILENIRRSGWDKYFKFKECLIKTDQQECVRKLQEEEKIFLEVRNGGGGEADEENGEEKIESHSGLNEDNQIEDIPYADGNENSSGDSEQTADVQTEDTKEHPDDDLEEQRAENLLNQLKSSENILVGAVRVKMPVLSNVASAPATGAISVKGCPEGFQAYHSSGTYNSCLYHSISILLAGDERLYKRLRLMATLFACKNFKQIIAEIEKKLKNKDLDYARHIFSNMLNVDHTTHMKSKAELIEDCVMRIIIETVTLGVDSCQMHVFFLSRALGRSIKSHHQTPQYADQYKVLDEVLDTSVEGDSEPLNIMWVHSGNKTDKEPNHVVPLVKRKNHSSDDDCSEDDEREGVKKRLLKDGSDRNSPQHSDSPHVSRDSCSSHSHASNDNDNVSGTGNTNEKDTQRESDKVSESTLRNESIDDDNGKENREHVWQSLLTPLK